MTKISYVVGVIALTFGTVANALPQTKYTSSCKLLAPKQGEYDEEKVPTITSESAYKKITAANEAYADAKYAESITILQDLIANSGDKAAKGRAIYLLGLNYREQSQYGAAKREFIRAMGTGVLGKQNEVNLRLALANIDAAQENYTEALRWMKEYFDEVINPPASSYAQYASLFYQNQDYRASICPAYLALQEGSKATKPLYSMLFAAHIELKDLPGAEVVGRDMVEFFPDEKSVYNNLFAVLSQRGKTSDMLALAELAYMNGMWDTETNYKQLSALYSNNQIPLLAAERLEEGVNKGIVEADEDIWRNIANSYKYAKVSNKAIAAYRKASNYTSNGRYDYDIATIYFSDEEYTKAIDAFRTAIRKGSLRDGDAGYAYLQMGVAYQRLGQPEQAVNALQQATNYRNVSKNATAYINYINQIESMKKELALND
ncbi:tetratricopeptide repeat protein [Kangiella koreensis]|uniref:Tetratricopeptide domain protein n=1 Tax=Kangiella koreensis (strain DSM 16069 / JCM 12317 / KCTC 12182 / SW-125) TaxID=523791 RepID=C7R6C1_KANKD|nr:tetratricopeptide repeat protein [Kangiella koreensis]ACV27349.1 Tetratricopeptide domain protein [Kangiella koreensis DSM 16069]